MENAQSVDEKGRLARVDEIPRTLGKVSIYIHSKDEHLSNSAHSKIHRPVTLPVPKR